MNLNQPHPTRPPHFTSRLRLEMKGEKTQTRRPANPWIRSGSEPVQSYRGKAGRDLPLSPPNQLVQKYYEKRSYSTSHAHRTVYGTKIALSQSLFPDTVVALAELSLRNCSQRLQRKLPPEGGERGRKPRFPHSPVRARTPPERSGGETLLPPKHTPHRRPSRGKGNF